ncbi:MAG: ABC transporter ATP-binding protein [Clostridiales bacterium]|jgi:ABC-2 type transport system ATP-binding protein|nr:ABC transporter ATP-binding protein [Clostridiales bacterium]
MELLKISKLSKYYGRKQALNSVSLSLNGGKIVGLLGPNGSGKTTMLKLINGLLFPNEGEILIEGENPGPSTKAKVSFLPDKEYIPKWMKIYELFNYYADFYNDFDKQKAEAMLMGLRIDINDRAGSLSKGNMEKLQLILQMSRNAKIYLLDEPIGGVDPAAREYILDTIIKSYNPDSLLIISTHLISDIERILDEVIFINKGEISLHSGVDEIRENKKMSVDEYFREVYR